MILSVRDLISRLQKSCLLIAAVLLLACGTAMAQAPDFAWAKQSYGQNPNNSFDQGRGVGSDSLGNSYITGFFYGAITFGQFTLYASGNDTDIFLVKYDPAGTVLWARMAGGGAFESGWDIAVDKAGNCYITGAFNLTATFGTVTLTSAGQSDIYIARYDADGNLIWAKRAGGINQDRGISIATRNNNTVYLTGFFSHDATFGNVVLTSNGEEDMFVARYDNAGNVLWAQRGGGEFASSDTDQGAGIAADHSGNCYVTGFYSGTGTFGNITMISAGNKDIFIAKYDAQGNLLWAKGAGGSNAFLPIDQGNAVAADHNGNVYITGWFNGVINFGIFTLTSAGDYDVFLTKYNASGNEQWARQAGGSGRDLGGDVAVDNAGNPHITGFFQATASFGNSTLNSTGGTDVFVARYDTLGTIIWAKSAGGDFSYSYPAISVGGQGQIFITGGFHSGQVTFGNITLANSGGNVFLAKFDPLGTTLWARATNASYGYDVSEEIATDAQGNSYFTGSFRGTTAFGNIILSSSGVGDVFLVKYDANGNVVWAKRAGTSASSSIDLATGVSVTTDAQGFVYVTGAFSGTCVFGNFTLSAYGLNDAFLAKYDASGNVLWAKNIAAGPMWDAGHSVAVDAQGNSYVSGRFHGTAATTFGTVFITAVGHDAFITKYDPAGNMLWAKKAGGNGNDSSTGIAVDHQGNICLTGSFQETANFSGVTITSAGNSDIFIAKYDNAGNILWAKSAGGGNYDVAMDISQDQYGNSYLTGQFQGNATFDTASVTSAGNHDFFIASYNTSGNLNWVRRAGGSGYELGTGVVTDDNGNSYITGHFNSTTTFDTITLTGPGFNNIFITKYDSAGHLLWAKAAGGTNNNIPTDIGIDAQGNSYITGYFENNALFGSSSLITIGHAAFVAKLYSEFRGINTGIIPDTGFCYGDTVAVPYSVEGTFHSGNVFTAHLSNASGSFTAPIIIGSVVATGSGVIYGIIPPGTPPGTGYRIRVVASDPDIRGTVSEIDLSIYPLPVVAVSAIPPVICQGQPVLLSASGANTYLWAAGNGLAAQSGATVQAVPAGPGAFTYTVTGISACSTSSTVQVTVHPFPAGSINGSVSVCPSVQEVSYWFTGAAGSTAYSWGVNGGSVAQQFGSDSITVNWGATNPGAYVWVIPQNNFGCLADTIKLPVTVAVFLVTPTPQGPSGLCADPLDSHTYSTFHTNGSTYLWSIQGGQITGGQTSSQIQVQWQQPGVGKLWVLQQSITITDTCIGTSDTLFVQLLSIPDSALAVQGSASVCARVLTVYSLSGSDSSTYQWQAQGGQVLSGQGTGNVEISWPAEGNFTLTVTETNSKGCKGRPISLPVRVNPVPGTAIVASPPGICPGAASELLYFVQGLAGSTYSWQPAGGQIIAGDGSNEVLIYWDTDAAFYGLTVTETSRYGCTGAVVTFPVKFDNSQPKLLSVTVDTLNESRVILYYHIADSLNYPQQDIEVQRLQDGDFITTATTAVAAASFTEINMATGQQAFVYRLKGQNLCAGELFSNQHATVWLQGQANWQTGQVGLSWSPYTGWENQSVRYRVWRKMDGEPHFQPMPELHTSATSVQAVPGSDGFNQCFRIETYSEDNRHSFSNSICFSFSNPLLVPNIITPNGDGINDVFVIDKLHLYPDSELLIFNRWGQQVHRNLNYQNNWNAENLPSGVYFYQLQAPGQPVLKGWIEVRR